jgi:hypothetical protein
MSPAPESKQYAALFESAHTFEERRALAAVIMDCTGPEACRKVTLDAVLESDLVQNLDQLEIRAAIGRLAKRGAVKVETRGDEVWVSLGSVREGGAK